jgi:anti-sigma regulatory factor (Ser/Thr protein kinase)
LEAVELRVPSSESFLEAVQVFVEKVGMSFGVQGDETTSLSIAVLELVKNAMEHGNGMDPDKHVTIIIKRQPGRIDFQIVDTGTWRPEQEPGYEPGEGEELFSSRGRGVLIARNLARWVEFDLDPKGKTRANLVWPLV